MTFHNWGRTKSCSPVALCKPADESALRGLLQQAARENRPVKVVGAGHSWSDIACTDGYQVNLDAMNRVIAVDHRRRQVTVQAGIRLHALLAELGRHRLSLPVVGSILEQSVAGAISTGTHGSAPRLGNLACQVASLRIMLHDGSVQDLDARQGAAPRELLRACRISLGALGVITQVTLDCVPAFALREVAEPMDFDEVAEKLLEIVDSAPYVKLWWLPHTSLVQVYRCYATDFAVLPGPPPRATRAWQFIDREIINARIFDRLLRASATSPDLIADINRAVRAVYFRKTERRGPSTVLLPVAMPPRHDETEYTVPLAKAASVLLALRELVDGPFGPRRRVNFPAELRFVATDDNWLSPMHGPPGEVHCCIGAYIAGSPDRDDYFSAFESHMQSLGGRPHWGKQFTATGKYLAAVYPMWHRFAKLRRQWDPLGRFENPYVRRLFSPEMGE